MDLRLSVSIAGFLSGLNFVTPSTRIENRLSGLSGHWWRGARASKGIR